MAARKPVGHAWAVMKNGVCKAVFGTRIPARMFARRHKATVMRVALVEVYHE